MRMPIPGDLILDRYEIISLIGQGAMGCVYHVRHRALGSSFAVKVLQPQYTLIEDYRHRFLREARINAQLRHPHAVQVYDVGQWQGWLYIVMEYLTGRPLRDHMTDGVALDWVMTMTVARQLASVLVAAHDISLVHRDLKPENIMVEYDEQGQQRMVVVDFGLAFIEQSEDLSRMTRDRGAISGTPAYLSPEQAMGGEVGPAADVYSMGCILYELLTGHAPFEAPSVMEIITRHMFVPPSPLRQINPGLTAPPAMEQLVLRMLSKDPGQRPDAPQVQARLEDLWAMPDHQGRGRQAAAVLSRAQRMVEGVTLKVAPLDAVEAVQTLDWTAEHSRALSAVTAPQLGTRVAFYQRSPLPETLIIALASNELLPLHAPTLEQCRGAAVIVAPLAEPSALDALKAIAPVIVPSPAGDMERIQALLRAGADEVVAWPMDDVQELARKIQRVLRKSQRRKPS